MKSAEWSPAILLASLTIVVGPLSAQTVTTWTFESTTAPTVSGLSLGTAPTGVTFTADGLKLKYTSSCSSDVRYYVPFFFPANTTSLTIEAKATFETPWTTANSCTSTTGVTPSKGFDFLTLRAEEAGSTNDDTFFMRLRYGHDGTSWRVQCGSSVGSNFGSTQSNGDEFTITLTWSRTACAAAVGTNPTSTVESRVTGSPGYLQLGGRLHGGSTSGQQIYWSSVTITAN